MLSFWKTRPVEVAGSTFYEVYRTTDAARKKDRIERRGGYYTSEREAEALAERLNEEARNEVNRR